MASTSAQSLLADVKADHFVSDHLRQRRRQIAQIVSQTLRVCWLAATRLAEDYKEQIGDYRPLLINKVALMKILIVNRCVYRRSL